MCVFTQQWRQAMQPDVMARRNRQAATDAAGEVMDRSLGVGDVGEDAARPRQQHDTALRQRDPASDAVEKTAPELLFEQGDAFADSRLRDMQALGRRRERAGFGDAYEGLQQQCIHGTRIPFGNRLDKNNEFVLF